MPVADAKAARIELKALHAKALAQFKFIAETETDQRKSELEALRFEAGDQWPAEAKIGRTGQAANGSEPAVPARPMLTMRTLDQPLAQIRAQEQAADLGIKIVPKDGTAKQDTADIFQGLVRAIEVDSHADQAYGWGFQRMSACGRGYWRVNKSYASDEDGFDQVLRIEPIENGASVYLDPMPTWQMGGGFWEPEYGFITEDLSEEQAVRRFGQARVDKLSDSETLTGLGDDSARWVWDVEDAGKFFRIAEYWYAVYDKTRKVDASDPTLARDILTRKVMWAKMDGAGWIDEPQEWDGRYIPIIQDSANKYNVGGKTSYQGMIQPAMSPARMTNYMVSAAAEKIGLATKSPWLAVAGQIEGFEDWWKQANTRNFDVLQYNAVTNATGPNILPPPTRNNDEPAIQAFAEMIGLFVNFTRSITGVPDAALGHVNPNDRSGKALEELKAASERGTSHYMQNHAWAIRHTGVVLLDLIPKVYDRPGRVERIVGEDGEPQQVMLNAPFVRGEDGQPEAFESPGVLRQMFDKVSGKEPPSVEEHELSKGQYAVIVNVGKSLETRRQESFMTLTMLLSAYPDMAPRIADLVVLASGMPDAEKVAARVKPPGVDEPGALPPEVQAMVQQLQAQMQELQAAADDNQTKLKIAAHADATKIQTEQIKAQTTITAAEIKAGIEDFKAQIQVLATLIGTEREERLAQTKHEHAVAQQLHGAAHELGMAAEQHSRQKELAQMQHEQAIEQGQQPPPLDPNRPQEPTA